MLRVASCGIYILFGAGEVWPSGPSWPSSHARGPQAVGHNVAGSIPVETCRRTLFCFVFAEMCISGGALFQTFRTYSFVHASQRLLGRVGKLGILRGCRESSCGVRGGRVRLCVCVLCILTTRSY